MTYPVTCACGKTHQVAGSAAGTEFVCDCRRTVEVPSYARLKASVGESAVSADFALEQHIQAGDLPLDRDCVACHRPTAHQIVATVVCERQRVSESGPRCYELMLSFALFGWIGAMIASRQRASVKRAVGEDRMFPLPVRVCERCAAEFTTARAVRDALERTPLYASLLEKYPRSEIRFTRP